MCGRYTLTVSAKTLAEAFHLAPIGFRVERHWNIAPGQYVIVIRPETNQRIADRAQWGLVPSWSKDHRLNHLQASQTSTLEGKGCSSEAT